MLYGLTDAFNRSGSLERALDVALEGIGRVLKVDRSSILLHDAEGIMRFVAWRGLSDEYRHAVDGHTPWPPDAKDPPALYVEDVDSDPSMTADLPVFRKGNSRAWFRSPGGFRGAARKVDDLFGDPRVFSERERTWPAPSRPSSPLSSSAGGRNASACEAMLAAEALGKRLQIITDAVPVLIAYVDRQERHRYASKAFETLVRHQPRADAGQERARAR